MNNILNKIIDFYKKYTDICNIIFLALIIGIGFLFFKDRFNGLLTDKGREMLFPFAIMQGKVLYKDILCIYFPLAFQINALGYKIFGVHLSVLMFFTLFNAFIICSALYFITREFINKNFALLFAVTYALASIYNGTLYNLLLPYSTSFAYGISAFLIGIFLIIRYLKTDNIKFLNIAYLCAGFALACKSEFMFLFFILCFVSFFFKPCSIKQNIKNIMIFSIIPIISFGILFLQGLTVQEFYSALDFMHKFFTSDSMIYHIKRTGALPCMINCFEYIPSIIRFAIFCTIAFVLFRISEKNIVLKVISVGISAYFLNMTNIGTNTILLPILIFLILVLKIKEIYNDKPLLILILAALALNIRMFWSLQLCIYGMYTAHILILSLIVILYNFVPDMKYLSKEELKRFVVYIIFIYLTFFTAFNYIQTNKNTAQLKTERGTLYLPQKKAEALDYAIKYIQQYSTPEQKILVLPEGMALNFLAERDLDYKLPMADRLYHEPLGDDKIIESIKNTDYEMIFIVEGYGLTNFGKPYLYTTDNKVIKYLQDHYVMDWKTEYSYGQNNNNTMYCYVKPY